MAKLYPPIVEGTCPAFYGTILPVPFTMNKTVGQNEVSQMVLRIKTIQSNTLIDVLTTSNINYAAGVATFKLNSSNSSLFQVGQYYKIQMAYKGANGLEGYYSDVSVIKYSSKPAVSIASLNNSTINDYIVSYVGQYTQSGENADITEKVYSYRFDVYDSDGIIRFTSGDKIHDTSTNVDNWRSSDAFDLNQEFELNRIYYIKYTVTTINNMTVSSPKYRIARRTSYASSLQGCTVSAKLNFDDSYIAVSLYGVFNTTTLQEETVSGNFILLKATNKDQYSTYDRLMSFTLANQKPSSWLFTDYTIEHGYTYKYAIQQVSAENIYSNKIYSNIVKADFEDSFLYDGNKQLKIRFNPKVTSFKRDILETKTDTIGSKFPYVFRNGNVDYKEFPISGLISYHMDDNEQFINKNKLFLEENNYSLTGDNIFAERLFKQEVLNFLTDGKPKVFKSPNEGSFIVRLMNTSLSPNDTVGRMLHTFSCTAYEIAEYNYENLVSYEFLGDLNKNSHSGGVSEAIWWKTVELAPNGVSVGLSYDILGGETASSVIIDNVMPGTAFIINGTKIVIGNTGRYEIPIGTMDITSLYTDSVVKPLYGNVTFSYVGTGMNLIDSVTSLITEDLPIVQSFGDSTNIVSSLNIIVNNDKDDNYIEKVNAWYYIKFIKRPMKTIYTDGIKFFSIYVSEEDNVELQTFDPYSIYRVLYTTSNIIYYVDGAKNNHSYASRIDDNIISNRQLYYAWFNGALIDLDETEFFMIDYPESVNSLIANPGVCLAYSYQRQSRTYKVDDDILESYKLTYDTLKNELITYLFTVGSVDTYFTSVNAMDAKEAESWWNGFKTDVARRREELAEQKRIYTKRLIELLNADSTLLEE